MKYLRKFATEAEIDVDASPNVVLVAESGEVKYNVPMYSGVYIQHIDGKLYTAEEWVAEAFSNNDANGVAVVAKQCQFVMAKSLKTSVIKWSKNTSTLIDGVLSTEDSAIAALDFNGEANTEKIAETDTRFAASTCINDVFPNGAKGYLPAAGELATAFGFENDINKALQAIGAKAIESWSYWSSTQYNATSAWTWFTGGNRLYQSEKSNIQALWVFAPLQIKN